ncbi:MAG: RNA polymerase sigma factor (sigma-70 family) [Glaciecola sp.]
MNLDQLIKACKKQQLKAQSKLYITNKDSLYMLCLKYCKNTEEAEDNLQDAFLSIFQNIKSYKEKGSFEGWMKRVTINKAIDKYKKEAFVNSELNDDLLADTEIEEFEHQLPLDTILKVIQELPNRYRLIFNLYEMDGYSHKEIADLLQISVGTSKSNLHRAKLILKEKIQVINKSQIRKKLSHGK